jgi:toxin ParE1/3/4
MRCEVLLTQDAERDLTQLYRYIREHDSLAAADHVPERLMEACESLSQEPERGSVPKELRLLGASEYRQVFFKPYRVIYRVSARQVVICVVMDGRRDMQALLTRRLLQS